MSEKVVNHTISFNFFQPELNDIILKLCNNINADSELEFSFGSYDNPITLYTFNKLLQYIKYKKTDNMKLIKENTLDVLYKYDIANNSIYRITISEMDNINTFIQNNILLKNHIIFTRLIHNFMNQNKNDPNKLLLINKIKPKNSLIKFDNYNIRLKLSDEKKDINQSILKNLISLDDKEKFNIGFRLKQRASLIIDDNDLYTLRIDVTDVKRLTTLNDFNNPSIYELEIDVTFKSSIDNTKLKKLLLILFKEVYDIERFIQESNLIITIQETKMINELLQKLLYTTDSEKYKDLPAMTVSTVEVTHILDTIPGKYSITDKADGERCFLLIANSSAYVIATSSQIAKKVKENIDSKYDNTIIDGEYIYIPEYKKYVFLAFDLLILNGTDIRTDELLLNRITKLYSIISGISGKNVTIKIYDGLYNLSNIVQFYKLNAIEHMATLNKLLKKSDDSQIIYCKYFIFPQAVGKQYDIYSLATMLYSLYNDGVELNNPYILDGLIFTPLQQIYTRNVREITYKMLKWKPINKNSIDFYITFLKNPDTGIIETVYDRTEQKIDETQPKSEDMNLNDYIDKPAMQVYQIATLHVGRFKNGQETPVPFTPDKNSTDINQAYIIVTNGMPRDIEGNVIQDKTVVEFAYDSTQQSKFKWIPLRTRFDKTEFIRKFNRKYGNAEEIANRNWNSIQNYVSIEDLKLLSNEKTSEEQVKLLKSKITTKSFQLISAEDKYYQLNTKNIGRPLRDFHNWIKSNIIYSYCSPKTLQDNTKVSIDVLDLGIGRGGDLMKFFTPKVKSIVGVDNNTANIYASSDSAISRLQEHKRKFPWFPKTSFVVADAGVKLDYENQSKSLSSNNENIKLNKQIFGNDEYSSNHNMFDVFNIQFMIHYLLENEQKWNGFCHNINKYLRKYGYVLISTLDGVLVNNAFKNNHITASHINDDGTSIVLYDIIKKYQDIDFNKLDVKNNLGITIDVHLSMFMNQDKYMPEYLVNPKFIINELKSKCNLRLIETDTFQNLFHVYENFFKYTANFESNLKTRKWFNDSKGIYNDDELTKKWFAYSKIHRYYIFQKM